ncbi:hypothetical protein CI102_6124 [Trichoderma harzianum]|nr:hypothetical protein CI102_6124 [Trichoderma harzianum]
MALQLHIPSCIRSSIHAHHPPPPDKPLRIQIEGPLVSTQQLLPNEPWHFNEFLPPYHTSRGQKKRDYKVNKYTIWAIAREAAHRAIYGSAAHPDIENDLVVRGEYLGWIRETIDQIDYYGVIFNHLVPPGDADPEVLQINIIEMDEDEGEYANACLPFAVDWKEFTSKRILAVPRCCQIRQRTTDRLRINEGIIEKKATR